MNTNDKKKGYEIEALKKYPAMPEGLNKYSRSEWCRIMPQLYNDGVISILDISLIEAYCNEIGKYFEYEEILQKEGRVITTKTGYQMASPYVTLSRMALKAAKELALQYGLTPISRKDITLKKVNTEPVGILTLIKKQK